MKLKDSMNVFSALADETRLRILNLLGEGELCVCDLMRVLKEPQSKISRHLAYLRRSRLVEGRRQGLWMYYRSAKPDGVSGGVLRALARHNTEIPEFKSDIREFHRTKGCLVACCK